MVVLGWVERPTDKLWPPFREADWRDSCRRGRSLRPSHVRRSAGGRRPATGVPEGAISFIRGFDPRTRDALFFFVYVFVRKYAEQHLFFQNAEFNFMPGRTDHHFFEWPIQPERGREVENAKKVEGADGPLERAHR